MGSARARGRASADQVGPSGSTQTDRIGFFRI
jgi:hypothetical protein